MYAIIETGGKQYRVAQGDLLQVELLDPGAESVTFDQVRLLSNGKETVLGTPRVDGASVTGRVVSTGRMPKILVFKKKRRKHYKRTIGHRQYFTAVRIEEIDAAGKIKPVAGKAPATTRKAAAKKTPAKKAAPKKKAAVKKTAVKKAAGKKAAGKKAAGKKAPVKKAGGAAAKKTTGKTTKKKTAPAKKAASKKSSGRS